VSTPPRACRAVAKPGRVSNAGLSVAFLARAALAALLFSSPASGQQAGSIAGKVVSASGKPVEGVQVILVDLRLRAATDASGAFRFLDVPPGEYLLEAANPRLGRSVARVQVRAGQEADAQLTLDVDVHHEVVVVTAQPDARSADELARPVAVLEGEQLRLRMEPTLGETLSTLPGVSSTYFGPGASRPIVRGIGGDRIRILSDGVGTFDASSTSPDHAVSFDPIAADRVEVVRGPATLLYGSSAVGGVVNTIDKRIPDIGSDHMVSGVLDLAAGSVSDEKSGAAALQIGRGPFIVRGDYGRRETKDLDIPGFAESAAQRAEEAEHAEEGGEEGGEAEEEVFGTLPNSAIESEGGSVSAALVGRQGFMGLAASGFDTLYGVPGGHGHAEEGGEHVEEGGEEHVEEGPVRIDLDQRRLDFRSGYTQPFGAFRAAKLRFGAADYQHVELEGDEIGTTFNNDAWEGRLELLHKPVGPLSGSFGAQLLSRDFEAIGAEAFVPPTETRAWALFAFEEVGAGALKGQLGVRYEHQDADALGDSPLSRSFDGLSGSAGFVWSGDHGIGLALTLARSVKVPNAEELYSNGPHIATRSFEIGDPNLEKETSLGLDLALRKRSGRFTGQVTLFGNWFDKYIFEELTGEEEDGLQVVQYVQKDARFVGAELEAHVDLLESEPHHLDLELSGDLVRARLTDQDQDLPRIPPARYGVALHYGSATWSARVEGRGALKQERIGPNELPTPSYAFLNASVGYRFVVGRSVVDLVLRGTNLTDEEGRVHASFLKDLVPLPGRDFRLNARLTF
jgi:iron complex outermembrane receptor protein